METGPPVPPWALGWVSLSHHYQPHSYSHFSLPIHVLFSNGHDSPIGWWQWRDEVILLTFTAQFLRAKHFLYFFAYIMGWRMRFAIDHCPGEESVDAFKDAKNLSYCCGAKERRRHQAGTHVSISQSCATSVTKHETGLNFPGFRFHIMLWASARYLEPRLGNFFGGWTSSSSGSVSRVLQVLLFVW